MRIKEIFIRHNMLFRMIMTMVLIICVPILIAGWIIVDRTYSNLGQQKQQIQTLNTSQFMQYFKAQYTNMVNTAVKIGYEQKVTAEQIEEHPMNELEAIKLLNTYRMSTPLANAVFIYFRGKDYVIGSEQKYIKDIFVDAYSGYNEITGRVINNMLNNVGESRTAFISNLSEGKKESNFPGLLLGVSISVRTKNDAVIIYYLNENIDLTFQKDLGANGYGLFIFDRNGDLLLSNNPPIQEAFLKTDLSSFLSDREDHMKVISLDQVDYSAYRMYDDKLGLSFVMTALDSEIAQSVQSFYRLLQLVVMILIILLLIILSSAVYINYRPILDLTRRVRLKEGSSAACDEIESINRALDSRESENEMLMDQIAEQKLKLTDYILINLLEGRDIQPHEINSVGLKLSGPYYCVIAIDRIVLSNADQAEISRRISEECGSNASFSQLVYEKSLILICTLEQPDRTSREALAKVIKGLLSIHKSDAPIRLGVGNCVDGLSQVRTSYLNAMTAVEQGGYDGITYYEEAVSSFSSYEKYPSEAVLRFIQCVKQGEKENAVSELHKIMQYISENIASQMIKQYIYYDMINLFLKTAYKMEVMLPDQYVHNLLMRSHMDQMEQSMDEAIERVCDEVSIRKQTSGQRLMEKVTRFIDENYKNPNINLPMVADHFGLSIYTLSGVFNASGSEGFREYIVRKRIEESCKMLMDNEMSVKEIAYDVGFRDVSYFIKSFKKHCGVTPSKYRQ